VSLFARSAEYHSREQRHSRHLTFEEIMGSLSVWHWLIILLVLSTYVVPVWRIITKAGFSGAWTLLTFVPVLNFIMLWVFAFSTWPRDRR